MTLVIPLSTNASLPILGPHPVKAKSSASKSWNGTESIVLFTINLLYEILIKMADGSLARLVPGTV